MSLTEIELECSLTTLPKDVTDYLREVDNRMGECLRNSPMGARGFVPCDFVTVYHALHEIRSRELACGSLFCEWGSGVGAVAALASLLGYDSCGIEIDPELCTISKQLAEDFGIPVDIVEGSYLPEGAEELIDEAYLATDGELSLVTTVDDAYGELDLDLEDFDVVFSYPWPNDVELTLQVFERFASRGALLLTYNEMDSVRLRRK